MADRTVKLSEFSGDFAVDNSTVMEYISHVDMSRIAGVGPTLSRLKK
jgi:hypothetical protein